MFKSMKKVIAVVAALGAAALGGSALAGATTSSTAGTASQNSASPSGSSTQARPAFPPHGTAAHEDAEKPVTGAAATKARAAAVKSVGGGTAGAVTTDMSGTGYEVTVTKSGGSKVEVHMDSSYNVMQGHGPGGPGGPPGGLPGGPGA